ncbi:hypothetical protein T439DRAFT_128613 [Meredithblackwellia eburnea MCA 4105]
MILDNQPPVPPAASADERASLVVGPPSNGNVAASIMEHVKEEELEESLDEEERTEGEQDDGSEASDSDSTQVGRPTQSTEERIKFLFIKTAKARGATQEEALGLYAQFQEKNRIREQQTGDKQEDGSESEGEPEQDLEDSPPPLTLGKGKDKMKERERPVDDSIPTSPISTSSSFPSLPSPTSDPPVHEDLAAELELLSLSKAATVPADTTPAVPDDSVIQEKPPSPPPAPVTDYWSITQTPRAAVRKPSLPPGARWDGLPEGASPQQLSSIPPPTGPLPLPGESDYSSQFQHQPYPMSLDQSSAPLPYPGAPATFATASPLQQYTPRQIAEGYQASRWISPAPPPSTGSVPLFSVKEERTTAPPPVSAPVQSTSSSRLGWGSLRRLTRLGSSSKYQTAPSASWSVAPSTAQSQGYPVPGAAPQPTQERLSYAPPQHQQAPPPLPMVGAAPLPPAMAYGAPPPTAIAYSDTPLSVPPPPPPPPLLQAAISPSVDIGATDEARKASPPFQAASAPPPQSPIINQDEYSASQIPPVQPQPSTSTIPPVAAKKRVPVPPIVPLAPSVPPPPAQLRSSPPALQQLGGPQHSVPPLVPPPAQVQEQQQSQPIPSLDDFYHSAASGRAALPPPAPRPAPTAPSVPSLSGLTRTSSLAAPRPPPVPPTLPASLAIGGGGGGLRRSATLAGPPVPPPPPPGFRSSGLQRSSQLSQPAPGAGAAAGAGAGPSRSPVLGSEGGWSGLAPRPAGRPSWPPPTTSPAQRSPASFSPPERRSPTVGFEEKETSRSFSSPRTNAPPLPPSHRWSQVLPPPTEQQPTFASSSPPPVKEKKEEEKKPQVTYLRYAIAVPSSSPYHPSSSRVTDTRTQDDISELEERDDDFSGEQERSGSAEPQRATTTALRRLSAFEGGEAPASTSKMDEDATGHATGAPPPEALASFQPAVDLEWGDEDDDDEEKPENAASAIAMVEMDDGWSQSERDAFGLDERRAPQLSGSVKEEEEDDDSAMMSLLRTPFRSAAPPSIATPPPISPSQVPATISAPVPEPSPSPSPPPPPSYSRARAQAPEPRREPSILDQPQDDADAARARARRIAMQQFLSGSRSRPPDPIVQPAPKEEEAESTPSRAVDPEVTASKPESPPFDDSPAQAYLSSFGGAPPASVRSSDFPDVSQPSTSRSPGFPPPVLRSPAPAATTRFRGHVETIESFTDEPIRASPSPQLEGESATREDPRDARDNEEMFPDRARYEPSLSRAPIPVTRSPQVLGPISHYSGLAPSQTPSVPSPTSSTSRRASGRYQVEVEDEKMDDDDDLNKLHERFLQSLPRASSQDLESATLGSLGDAVPVPTDGPIVFPTQKGFGYGPQRGGAPSTRPVEASVPSSPQQASTPPPLRYCSSRATPHIGDLDFSDTKRKGQWSSVPSKPTVKLQSW